MATSILMACDDENTNGFNGSEEARSESGKQSGRRKSKLNESTQKKKQPQRGMGVAQLERLRLQERWKKMTEINPLHLLPSSFPDPTRIGVPVQLAKYSPYSSTNGVGDQSGLNQALLIQRFGNGGFHGFSGSSGVSGVYTDSLVVDPFGVGASTRSFRVGNGIETSTELSSMPNMRGCYSERCGVCHKKKRMNGENLVCNGVMRDMHRDISPMNGCNVFGFSPRNSQNINGESTRRAPGLAGYSGHNVDKEAEVVAVHRKGSCSSAGKESVFMEYEFFPAGKDGSRRSTCHEDLKLGFSEASVAGEASCFPTTYAAGVDPSNSIDLSLKLSY